MKLVVKVLLLSMIIAINLLFFLVFKQYFHGYYEAIFRALPWPDFLEEMFAIIIGFIIVVLALISIVRIAIIHPLVKQFKAE